MKSIQKMYECRKSFDEILKRFGKKHKEYRKSLPSSVKYHTCQMGNILRCLELSNWKAYDCNYIQIYLGKNVSECSHRIAISKLICRTCEYKRNRGYNPQREYKLYCRFKGCTSSRFHVEKYESCSECLPYDYPCEIGLESTMGLVGISKSSFYTFILCAKPYRLPKDVLKMIKSMIRNPLTVEPGISTNTLRIHRASVENRNFQYNRICPHNYPKLAAYKMEKEMKKKKQMKKNEQPKAIYQGEPFWNDFEHAKSRRFLYTYASKYYPFQFFDERKRVHIAALETIEECYDASSFRVIKSSYEARIDCFEKTDLGFREKFEELYKESGSSPLWNDFEFNTREIKSQVYML